MNSRAENLLIILTLVSMESSHLVIFLTSGKFITKFNILCCISLRGGGYWLKLGVTTCFLQCSVEREPQEITRQMYIFLERS